MRILTPEEIKIADQLTVKDQKITSIDLMERAANLFSKQFLKKYPNPGKGIIVCGPGNNGGDGLAMARILSEKLSISVFLPSGFSSFSKDYKTNLKKIPKSVQRIKGNAIDLAAQKYKYDWICDALFGIGLNRPPEGEVSEIIKTMNEFNGIKISMDVPSGLGEFPIRKGQIFEADWVGTFHCPKLKFLTPAAQNFMLEFEVIDIQLKEPEKKEKGICFLEEKEISSLIKKRKKFSHKGTYGHALLISGSIGKMGATVLAAMAMIRSGIGLATVFAPKSGRDILQVSIPEAMLLLDKDKKIITCLPPFGPYQSIGIGPGLGKDDKTKKIIKQTLERAICPLVLDADALNILSENKDWLSMIPKNSILTPHPKEFERLAGKSDSDEMALQKAINFSIKHHVFLVLKNAHTLIACPNGECHFNSTGNPGMAKGGSGDALTGLITGLLGQGYSPLDSCKIGVFVHGRAGDLAAAEKGQIGMTISDLVQKIGPAFQSLNQA